MDYQQEAESQEFMLIFEFIRYMLLFFVTFCQKFVIFHLRATDDVFQFFLDESPLEDFHC